MVEPPDRRVDPPDASTADPADTGSTPTPEPAATCGAEGAGRRWCTSCDELLSALPDTPSGPVTLQLPEGGTHDTFCEMATAGGGWTLAATNGFDGYWNVDTIFDAVLHGAPSLAHDHKGPAFVRLPFRDLLFETDEEYAVYLDVGDGTLAYQVFQDLVPRDNCGIDTPWEWPMAEGTLADPDLCETHLYMNVSDWEGDHLPCGDSEDAAGPAWSGTNKGRGCPLDDPYGTSFIGDPWDYNVWGDHDPNVRNLPLRMWVR